jgi:hypothetical protein
MVAKRVQDKTQRKQVESKKEQPIQKLPLLVRIGL